MRSDQRILVGFEPRRTIPAMDLDAYFRRIGYSGPRDATLGNLRAMQRAHFYNVPFENLDIARGRRIQVDEAVNFTKVVGERRGGFCLELTGLFARVLRQLGYRVDVLAARVMTPDGQLSYPASHMTSVVHLDEPWIVDVGFGGRIAGPLRLADRGVQEFEGRKHTVANDGDHWLVTVNEAGNGSMTYLFTLEPREWSYFSAVCEWLQTSPDSRFTGGDIVSLARPDGRATIGGGRLIVTEGEQRQERDIASPEDERGLLKEMFGLSV